MKIKFSINLFLSKFFSSFDVRGPIQKRLPIMDFQTEIKDGCPDCCRKVAKTTPWDNISW